MEKILSLLAKIYPPNEVEFLATAIKQLMLKYQKFASNASTYALSEKDLALISYGDSFFAAGEKNLRTLHKTLLANLKDEVSILHILPFFPYSSDDGFSIIDYYAVDPKLGEWQDVTAISADFKLMFDAVINHSSRQCEWFSGFLREDTAFQGYYIEMDDLSAYPNVVRPRTSPLSHTYTSGDYRKEVWTTFSEDQVDLNFKNPRVFLQILDVLLFYITKGASVIRLDAVGFLWKEKNSTCIHLPQTHLIIRAFRKIIEALFPGTLLITETNVPHQENISYFGDGNEAHMVYNFTLPPLLAYSLLSGKTEKLLNWANTLELPCPNVCFFNFLASHDGIGLRPVESILDRAEIGQLLAAAVANGGAVSYKANPDGSDSPYEINSNYFSLLKGEAADEMLGIKRMLLAHAILLTMPGLPAIYLHSMFGSENDLPGMKESGIKRRINREKLQYENLTDLLSRPDTRQSIILNSLKEMARARQTEAAFNPYSAAKFGRPAAGVFSIERISADGESRVYGLFNFRNESVQVSFKDAVKKQDLLSKDVDREAVVLAPMAFKWYKI